MIFRELRPDEYELLKAFLYEAIFIPKGETPSLAMSVLKDHRGQGIGTHLLQELISLLSEKGYKRISLSVQKANYAVRMYERAGFRTILENDDEYIMVCDLLNESGLRFQR